MKKQEISQALSTASPTIKRLVADRVTSQAVPGLAAAVFLGNEVLYFQGEGQRELGAPAPEDSTAFRIASCTKSFTAVATLILRDRGELSLDDPITKYMPMYRQVGPLAEVAPPTLRMLLAMSAGFGTDDPWADREESITQAQLEAHVANGVYLISTPGSRYEYSNLGYALLGRVIELVSEETFPQFVTREIFESLELNDSSFSLESSQASNVAVGYRRRGDEWLAQEFAQPGSFSSIGGVFSSTRDLAKWAAWLGAALNPMSPESGPLSLSSRREMQQMHISMPFSSSAATTQETENRLFGYGFALHVDIDQNLGKFVSHSGGYPGYSAHMRWHEKSGLGVIVLENARYSGAWATATTILESIVGQLSFTDAPPLTEVLDDFVTRASSLIGSWNDELANSLFAPNVAMDIPYEERTQDIEQLIGKIGGLIEVDGYQIETDESPLHVRWLIPGHSGNLLCELRLTPVQPLKIQTLRISIQ
jgi:CubicO group peptidase (beta-lactamase class C family)